MYGVVTETSASQQFTYSYSYFSELGKLELPVKTNKGEHIMELMMERKLVMWKKIGNFS